MFEIKDKEERISALLKKENEVEVQQGKKGFMMGKDQIKQARNRLEFNRVTKDDDDRKGRRLQ